MSCNDNIDNSNLDLYSWFQGLCSGGKGQINTGKQEHVGKEIDLLGNMRLSQELVWVMCYWDFVQVRTLGADF